MGSKITATGDCSHEIKRRLLRGRKVMTNLDSILKSRDITLPTKVQLVKAMVSPVVVYGWESWILDPTNPRRKSILALVSLQNVKIRRELDQRRLSADELMLSNCGVGEDS